MDQQGYIEVEDQFGTHNYNPLGLFYKEICELTSSHKVLPIDKEKNRAAVKIDRSEKDENKDIGHTGLRRQGYP